VENASARKQKVHDILSHEGSLNLEKSEYPFNDSDDNY
jgi:hypothetical protein